MMANMYKITCISIQFFIQSLSRFSSAFSGKDPRVVYNNLKMRINKLNNLK